MQNFNVRERVKTYTPKELSETKFQAAVMLILVQTPEGEWEVVLTKRSENLPTYPGDYSFPGGMADALDVNLFTTAQREVFEELNIEPEAYEYVGQLDDFQDRYGQLVRPFVVTMQKTAFQQQYQFSTTEITAIYYFSISRLDEIVDNPNLHEITRRHPSYSFLEQDTFIWGLTANLLVHLGNILNEDARPLGKLVKNKLAE